MKPEQQPGTPATLSPQSRAAAAQRVDERPLPTSHGLFYDIPHHPLHPRSWHLRRHLKRKHLRRSNQRYTATDRVGTRWSLLPLTFVLLALMVSGGSLFIGYGAFTMAVNQRYQGDVVRLIDILPKDSLRMYDEQGTPIYEAVNQGLQISEPFNSISPNLVYAEIAIEDQYFWTNPGYDITGIVRATLSNLTHGRIVAGGSTITQQLIKNLVVGNTDTITRKLEEIILAPQATRYYTKQQIMDMYLNTTYYGNLAYGVEAAAFVYFGSQDTSKTTAAAQLDLAQAAMLAGIPQNPTLYDPFLHPQATFLRVEAVLTQMRLQGYITPAQERQALAEVQSPHFLRPGIVNNTLAPHFVAYTLNELATTLHVKIADLSRSGLIVSTTLDLPLQNKILAVAQQNVAALSIPAVKVLYKTSVDASLHTAQAMGITSYNGTPNYTMVLGTLGVHLLDMTSAYGVFADGGMRVPPHTIDTVYDTQGKLVYRFLPTGQRVISPQIAYLMTNVLSDNRARTFEFGACSSLYLYSNTQTQCYTGNPGTVYPSAVKTGTSQNFADNWTIGYTTNYVMGVWAGNNNNSPMINVIGVTGAGPIWHEGMLLAEQERAPSNFPTPPGLVQRTVTYPEGTTTTDWYIKGVPWTDWGLGWPGSL